MSVFATNTLLALANGSRTSAAMATGNKRYYNTYRSVLPLPSEDEVPVDIRIYSPSALDVPHPDGTIALVLANSQLARGPAEDAVSPSTLVLEGVYQTPS